MRVSGIKIQYIVKRLKIFVLRNIYFKCLLLILTTNETL